MAVSEKLRKKLLKRQEDLKKGNGDYKTIFFKEGKTKIRALTVGDEEFAREVTQFYLNGEVIISPATFGEPCALMEAFTELKSSTDSDDQELSKNLRPTRRYYMPAIKYTGDDGKEIDGEPRLAILTKGLFEQLIEYMLDDDNGDFTDPDEGYDLNIIRSGKGKNDTEYRLTTGKSKPIHKSLRNKVFNIEDMIRELIPSYDATKEALDKFLGMDPEADDEDDTPRKASKKPSKKVSEDLEDDEDDTPRKPRKKVLKKKLKK